MRWFSIMIVLFALFINCVSCEKKPLSDRESILKTIRKKRHFESSYNNVDKKSFESSFPGKYVPSFEEFLNSAVIEIANDIAVLTCSLEMESDNHKSWKDISYIIKLKKTDKQWKIVMFATPSSGGGAVGAPVGDPAWRNERIKQNKEFEDKYKATLWSTNSSDEK